MKIHAVSIEYNEEESTAGLHCPLCKDDWKFPLSSRQNNLTPWPEPKAILRAHLYGYGTDPKPCPGLDSVIVESVRNIDATTAEMETE